MRKNAKKAHISLLWGAFFMGHPVQFWNFREKESFLLKGKVIDMYIIPNWFFEVVFFLLRSGYTTLIIRRTLFGNFEMKISNSHNHTSSKYIVVSVTSQLLFFSV